MPDAITDDGVARLRQRIGIARPHTNPPHYLTQTRTLSATSPTRMVTTTPSGATRPTALGPDGPVRSRPLTSSVGIPSSGRTKSQSSKARPRR